MPACPLQSTRGSSDTLRQRLKRDKALADAGVALATDSRLFRHPGAVQNYPAGVDSGSDSSDSGDGDQHGARSTSHALDAAAKEDDAPETHQSASDSEIEGAVAKPRRDLSQAQPPVALTFSKHRARGMITAGNGAAGGTANVPAEAMAAAQQAKQALIEAGHVPGVLLCSLAGTTLFASVSCSCSSWDHVLSHRQQHFLKGLV